ncbi:MAG: hypothetical protein IT374_06100 [Polyangiaceae bacterium]|nr:hypothetical protein [Polyangiaceae bacterium]
MTVPDVKGLSGAPCWSEGLPSARRGRAGDVAATRIDERRRPLRVARMLAIAHEVVRLVDEGAFEDLADAARTLGFTRARITQIVDLTLLAPEIQEALLFAEVPPGRDPVTERGLREVVAAGSWRGQRAGWTLVQRRNVGTEG